MNTKPFIILNPRNMSWTIGELLCKQIFTSHIVSSTIVGIYRMLWDDRRVVTSHTGEVMNGFTEEVIFDLVPEEQVRFHKEEI